ncbi:hypothetical protein DXG03_000027 [Asterophora parasitica]|uniref:Ribosomal RNA-processing protein 8 n=1 Tax=Asterophora parasitica TaxID=117018 RepID=A0A9P7GEW0_9AGAR|nr:hypothetical protein DXG03_000027 [Asterophora parasitica]
MPLFDVPGWSVTAPPVTEASTSVSKKRKRPAGDSQRLHSAELNLEKLVNKLKGNFSSESLGSFGKHADKKAKQAEFSAVARKADKKKEKKAKARQDAVEVKKKTISRPMPLQAAGKDSGASPTRPAKKAKTKHTAEASSSQASLISAKKSLDGSPTGGLTALQKGMKQSLDGARFRWVGLRFAGPRIETAISRLINESLYKTDSAEAHQMMKEDPRVFEDYHAGFRHQVQVWPTNPVEHYISTLSTYPQRTVIADLGCGDAALSRDLIPKGMTVLSFDLVSDGAYVVEADVCNKIPLPGSEGTENEKSDGEAHVVDVVICALSLMGTNWPNCLREAWRILKPGGELKIAEVASRFTDMEEFQSLVGSIGFKLQSKDDSNSHFTLFEFKKTPRRAKSEKEWSSILSRASLLKPCEYKRR